MGIDGLYGIGSFFLCQICNYLALCSNDTYCRLYFFGGLYLVYSWSLSLKVLLLSSDLNENGICYLVGGELRLGFTVWLFKKRIRVTGLLDNQTVRVL